MIIVNMTKAKEIKKNIIRAKRKPILESLDIQFVRAVEANDINLQAEISNKKQALRDATKDPAIDAATTPEELSMVRPAALDAA